MSNQPAPWRKLIDQLGADQVEEIENEEPFRDFLVGRPHSDGHIVTDKEWDDRLLEMAVAGADRKRQADENFIGVAAPAGAIGICVPKQIPRDGRDGASEGVWIRPFRGTKRVTADGSYRVQIVGAQNTHGDIERRIFTQTEEEFSQDMVDEWRNETLERDTARERASLLIAACREIDMLVRDEQGRNGHDHRPSPPNNAFLVIMKERW